MWLLLPYMVERMAIIVMIAFLLTRLKTFRLMVRQAPGLRGKLMIAAIFGIFGIISTYTGIEVSTDHVVQRDWITTIEPGHAIANTRNLGVVIGGLLGGPLTGLGVGLIAGGHRYLLGGFTGLACAIATVTGGLVAGWIGRKYREQGMITPNLALVVGMLVEVMQMGIILLVSKPFAAALELVKLIGLPMIVVNGFGVWIFVHIIHSVLKEEERTRALETQKALSIADRTLPYFRQGLNENSCREAAQIIYRLTGADAIAISDRQRVLAHVGAGADHHRAGQNVSTELTKTVLKIEEIVVAKSREEISCFHPDCPLNAAVVLPLKVRDKTVGTLKLYFTDPHRLSTVERELAEGLARLFSTQLELGDAEMQSKLLRDAEIKALQAQVHPHFLFNAINTIVALCRTDAMLARKLLLNLGTFFRSNLQGARQTLVPLEKELEHVEAYLSLEQARFPGRYTLKVDIEPGLEQVMIPPFTMQPLVENAVRHAFAGIGEGGVIEIAVASDGNRLRMKVSDNGAGIAPEKLGLLGTQEMPSPQGTGTALQNIRERLFRLYGKEAEFRIESKAGDGTAVLLTLPIAKEKEERMGSEC